MNPGTLSNDGAVSKSSSSSRLPLLALALTRFAFTYKEVIFSNLQRHALNYVTNDPFPGSGVP